VTATAIPTRYLCRLTERNNDLCTFAWFDLTPEQLKEELARLKAVFEKAVKTKSGKKFFNKKGYLSNSYFEGSYNIPLYCGDFSHASDDDHKALDANEWLAFDPLRTYDYEGDTPAQEAPGLPTGVDPEGWDANIDDYAIRLTATGVYFIVESTYEEDELDETPELPYDYIK
jgi:hypothetical protein